MHREGRRDAATSQGSRGRPGTPPSCLQREQDPPNTLISDCSLHACETVNFCCRSHATGGTLLWQPWDTDTQPCPLLPLPSCSRRHQTQASGGPRGTYTHSLGSRMSAKHIPSPSKVCGLLFPSTRKSGENLHSGSTVPEDRCTEAQVKSVSGSPVLPGSEGHSSLPACGCPASAPADQCGKFIISLSGRFHFLKSFN